MAPVVHVAFDVHAQTSTFCIQDADGTTLREGVVRTGARSLLDVVRPLRGTVHVAFEEGTQAQWLIEVFEPHVHRVQSCDPRRLGALTRARKSDRHDARLLCTLSRAGLLRPIRPRDQRVAELREHVALHQVLVQDVVRTKNRVKAIFRGRGIPTPGRAVYERASRREWLARLSSPARRRRARVLLRTLDHLQTQRTAALRAMVHEARRHDGFPVLTTVPGIGPVRAARLIAWLISPHRFRTRRQLWAYAGLAVVHHTSSDWTVRDGELVRRQWQASRGLNRNHHPGLKHLFKSIAVDAITRGGWAPVAAHHTARGLSPALVRITVARRLASICLSLWKRGVPYDPERALPQPPS